MMSTRYQPTPQQRELQRKATVRWSSIGGICSIVGMLAVINDTDGLGATFLISAMVLVAIWVFWVGPVIYLSRLGVVDPQRARRLDLIYGGFWVARTLQNRHNMAQANQARQVNDQQQAAMQQAAQQQALLEQVLQQQQP